MSKIKNLYIIAGCNGAGKTTASYNILPQILDCKEFVNADEIAKGLSPFQPEKVALQAGKILLNRIEELMGQGTDFAFETTLSTKTYQQTILKAQERGYFVSLLFFWLNNVQLAKQRVAFRVQEGGHYIPDEVIERRYQRGLKNLFELYLPICNNVMLFDNSDENPIFVMKQIKGESMTVFEESIFQKIKQKLNNG
jgi:predicted ABC-type ATPase